MDPCASPLALHLLNGVEELRDIEERGPACSANWGTGGLSLQSDWYRGGQAVCSDASYWLPLPWGGGVVKIKPQSKGLTGRSVCFNCFISVASFPPSLASLQYQRYITLGSGKGAG